VFIGGFDKNMLGMYRVPCIGVVTRVSCNLSCKLYNPLSDHSVEYLKYYTVTGLLNPNNQYNIY